MVAMVNFSYFPQVGGGLKLKIVRTQRGGGKKIRTCAYKEGGGGTKSLFLCVRTKWMVPKLIPG